MAEGKGGWIGVVHVFPSTMAQNFWIAIVAWSVCFLVTIAVSLATRPRAETELRGLVFGLTATPNEPGLVWYKRPAVLAVVVGVICLLLNFLFW